MLAVRASITVVSARATVTLDPRGLNPIVFETVSSSDALTLSIELGPFLDSVTPGDFVTFALNNAQADTAVTDDFSTPEDDAQWTLSKLMPGDFALAVDASSFDLSGTLLDQTGSAQDALAFSLAQAQSDSATPADALALSVTASQGDAAVSTDALAFSLTQGQSDSATAGSNGWLAMQDYVDTSYWREDYTTGTYRTFT